MPLVFYRRHFDYISFLSFTGFDGGGSGGASIFSSSITGIFSSSTTGNGLVTFFGR